MIELGVTVKDTITGFTGVAVANTAWLHGCSRVGVQSAKLDSNGKVLELQWFDEPQLKVITEEHIATSREDIGGPMPTPARAPDPGPR